MAHRWLQCCASASHIPGGVPMKRSAAVAAVLLAILAALPLVLDHEQRVLDDGARAAAGGRFAQLSDGSVHYRHLAQYEQPDVVNASILQFLATSERRT